ncbi:MAG: NADH-quinone oxidoreductase subunit C [Actinomycetota bacterium]|nr:NADH-quinone oxidoreductase subunit C [Actinomycetota bacterium]
MTEVVGGERFTTEFGSVKVHVPPDRWTEVIRSARDALDLSFFSFLSAIDWSREVEVGDPPEASDQLEERFEVLCHLSSLRGSDQVTFSVDVPKDRPELDSLVEVFAGANWHERETHEMFGIDFLGHPHLVKLYLPDAFEGYPLRKSFPLLTREVKPWPGLVDVEDMPAEEEAAQKSQLEGASEENPEAGG